MQYHVLSESAVAYSTQARSNTRAQLNWWRRNNSIFELLSTNMSSVIWHFVLIFQVCRRNNLDYYDDTIVCIYSRDLSFRVVFFIPRVGRWTKTVI